MRHVSPISTNQCEMVLFSLGDEQLYGINVFKTKEIIDMPALSDVPGGNPKLVGLALIRNEPLVFIDLNLAIGKSPIVFEEEDGPQAIIAEFNNSYHAFKIEKVHRIIRINWEDCMSPPSDTSYLTSVVVYKGQLVEILDIEKIVHDTFGDVVDYSRNLILSDYSGNEMLGKRKILVVDDSSLVRKKTYELVSSLGIECIVCSNGQEAMGIINKIKSEVSLLGESVSDRLLMVLTDIEMPLMDGLAFIEEVRKDSSLDGLCIAIHSSICGGVRANLGDTVGVDDYLVKWDEKGLFELIDKKMGAL
jgi:two-component system chemotaxis response regulator CheV